MLTDVPGDIIGHSGFLILAGDRGEIYRISVRMQQIIAQDRPVARHFVEAPPSDKIVVRISAACLVCVQLLPAVFIHPRNAVLIIVPGLSLAAEIEFPLEIGVAHYIEKLQGLFLVRTVRRNEPHIAGAVAHQLIDVRIIIGGGSRDRVVPGERIRIGLDLIVVESPLDGMQSHILSADYFGVELLQCLGE